MTIRFAALIISTILLVSCRNRDDVPPRNDTGELIVEEKGVNVDFSDQLEGVETIPLPIVGTWEVIEYSKEKNDQTQSFEGYTLSFNADGTVDVIEDGEVVFSGTYIVVPIDGTNELRITFPIGSPIPSLNYPWSSTTVSDEELAFEWTSKDLILRRV